MVSLTADSPVKTTEAQPPRTTSIAQLVGARLRAMRTARGLTMRVLAKMSGLSVNTLSLIERGRTSPSVNTLQQLATQLQEPISAFFDPPPENQHVLYQKSGQRPRVPLKQGALENLGEGMPRMGAEPLIFIMEGNAESGKEPCVHTGREFVYCLEGQILFFIEDSTYLLTPGDSLLFDAYLPHRWKNLDSSSSSALFVFCPTDLHNYPTDDHFSK
jgi:transcriptional regulator with XRE-family HTH domain